MKFYKLETTLSLGSSAFEYVNDEFIMVLRNTVPALYGVQNADFGLFDLSKLPAGTEIVRGTRSTAHMQSVLYVPQGYFIHAKIKQENVWFKSWAEQWYAVLSKVADVVLEGNDILLDGAKIVGSNVGEFPDYFYGKGFLNIAFSEENKQTLDLVRPKSLGTLPAGSMRSAGSLYMAFDTFANLVAKQFGIKDLTPITKVDWEIDKETLEAEFGYSAPRKNVLYRLAVDGDEVRDIALVVVEEKDIGIDGYIYTTVNFRKIDLSTDRMFVVAAENGWLRSWKIDKAAIAK